MRFATFFIIALLSFALNAKDNSEAWEKLLKVASTEEKVRLLEEAIELNYSLPDSWKSLWDQKYFRPLLLELSSTDDWKNLLEHSPLSSWSKDLRRHLWLKCWFLKQNSKLPDHVISQHEDLIKKEAPYLIEPTVLPEPSKVSGNPLSWNPYDCQHHLIQNWQLDTIKKILSSDRYDLNRALANAWLERKESLSENSFTELWTLASHAGRSAVAHVLIESPNPELLEVVKTSFEKQQHRELCLRILKAMSPPPLATWMLDQFSSKGEPWMSLSIHYMLEMRDVEASRRYIELFEGPLVKKKKLLPIGEVVILMGMSKHDDVVAILSKLLKLKDKSPVSHTYIIQAMAEHGHSSFLKTVQQMLKKDELNPLLIWAIERLKGLHERPYSPPPRNETIYYPHFKSLP